MNIRSTTLDKRPWRIRCGTSKALGILVGIALLLLLPGTGIAANKVLICHYPPDSPENRAILSVSVNSLADHESHGDNVLGTETCDLIDNDCDGLVDEDNNGNPLINPTICGVGECAGNSGFETCENGIFVNDTCDPLDGATPEFCDSLDNDCDGLTDENSSGNPLVRLTTCGTGVCAGNTGFETCSGGTFGNNTCNPLDGASPEICDGLNNDCDGATDEDDDMCSLAQVCDGSNGCVIDPSLYCPCGADLDAANWDDGSIPFGGCISDDGDGFPSYGLAKEFGGGYDHGGHWMSFFINAVDLDDPADGIPEYTCVVRTDYDGSGPVASPVYELNGDAELLGCSARMNNYAKSVYDCVTN